MSSYLLIESRSSFIFNDVHNTYDLAASLRKAGHSVTLFLIQNGVLPLRKKARHDTLLKAVSAGVTVYADGFSLEERAIAADRICDGVSVSDLGFVVDQLAGGAKTIWF